MIQMTHDLLDPNPTNTVDRTFIIISDGISSVQY
jgi:hypothetical protein